jgi:hypothetical protein
MPTGTCPDCGHVVAPSAEACPNCGNREFYRRRGRVSYSEICGRCKGKGWNQTVGRPSICESCNGKGVNDWDYDDTIDSRNPNYAERERENQKRKEATRRAKEFLATRVATQVSFAEADMGYERREAKFKQDDQAHSAKSCLIMFLIPGGIILSFYGLSQGSGIQVIAGIGLVVGYFVVRRILINSYYDNLGKFD